MPISTSEQIYRIIYKNVVAFKPDIDLGFGNKEAERNVI